MIVEISYSDIKHLFLNLKLKLKLTKKFMLISITESITVS